LFARTVTSASQTTVYRAVGATLFDGLRGTGVNVHYWAGRNREVDYVICRGSAAVAIEVKSGRKQTSLPGLAEFSKQFPVQQKLRVGVDGIPVEEFLAKQPATWLD
jgi:predicted AAA+ superfamily ATPase